MKKTKLQEMTSTKFGQLKVFIRMAKYARTNGAFGGPGIFKEDLTKKGISEEIFDWLVKEHYIAYHPGKALWIANTNKLYPSQTIDNLEMTIKKFEIEQMSVNLDEKI